jgi:hypothetical protein
VGSPGCNGFAKKGIGTVGELTGSGYAATGPLPTRFAIFRNMLPVKEMYPINASQKHGVQGRVQRQRNNEISCLTAAHPKPRAGSSMAALRSWLHCLVTCLCIGT